MIEAGSMLGVFLAITLVLANLIFAFFTQVHWLWRGVFESLTLIPLYTMVSSAMMGLIQFAYNPLWLGVLVLLISPLITNILLNYFVK
jgi:hypothetical protein